MTQLTYAAERGSGRGIYVQNANLHKGGGAIHRARRVLFRTFRMVIGLLITVGMSLARNTRGALPNCHFFAQKTVLSRRWLSLSDDSR